MRYQDSGWGYAKAGFVGAVVAAVLMLSFPVVAAVGNALMLGQTNSVDATTWLSGTVDANLRLTNTKPGSPALDLHVVPGAPPLEVSSRKRVPKLNADLLDGKHASYFAAAAHTHTGVSFYRRSASTEVVAVGEGFYQDALCDVGDFVTGGGYSISGAATIKGSHPVVGKEGWYVDGFAMNPLAMVNVWVICAHPGDA